MPRYPGIGSQWKSSANTSYHSQRNTLEANGWKGSKASLREAKNITDSGGVEPDLSNGSQSGTRTQEAPNPMTLKANMEKLGNSAPRHEPRTPPPEGAHRGGPLGFFAARAQLDKKD